MRGALLALLLTLSACAPIEVVPRAALTRATCGLAPRPPDPEGLFTAPTPTSACVEAIRADFRAEGDLGTLVDGAVLLLATDLGGAEATGAWAGRPFADALAAVATETGGTDAGALLYDYSAARFTSAGPGDCGDADAATNVLTGELVWCAAEATPVDAAALLVHEARHRDGYEHVGCGDGERAICDRDRDGPVSFQAAVYERSAQGIDDAASFAALERRIALLAERIR